MSDVGGKVTSHQIKAAIRANWPAPSHQTFFEVSNDTGLRIRNYADAVVVGIWPSTGHEIHGIEIKVSRQDFLNEMKNPNKSQPIYKYCDRWSLICPAGMVKADELPISWGMMTYNDGKIRNAKIAPVLAAEPVTRGFFAALARRAGEMDDAIVKTAVDRALADQRARHQIEIDRKVERQSTALSGELGDTKKRLQALLDAVGGNIARYEEARFVDAVKFVMRSGVSSDYSTFVQLINVLDGAKKTLTKAFETAGIQLPESAQS